MNDIKSTEAAGSNPQSNPINVTMKGGAATGGSPSFNNNITTTSDQTTTSTSSWGTWEELLLACAVKRYGVHDWDTVALELQAKTSLPPLLTTASNCKLKYLDLRRRFRSRHQNDDVPPVADDNHHDPDNNNTNNIPWLDDLRKLRVAQLRQELHRYDVSIVSLQLKVKRLEEEREESFKDDDPKPDLEDQQQQQDSNRHRSENDKTVQGEPDGSKPDHENQSVNGSNSTCSKNLDHDNKSGPEDRALSEPGLLPAGSAEPSKRTGSGQSDSDSDKGSSETVAKNRKEPGRQGKGGGDSADKMRESSEAQSSVSLTKKWNGKRRRIMEVPEEQQQHNNGDVSLVKSQPLVEVLQLICAQEYGSLFERRLPAQESDKYKSIVQQHVDLETIQTKLRKDAYSSCSLSFYRDLLLLFNNAVVFFPKSSLESRTAHQLRRLVLNEMKKKNLITRPNHDPSSEPSDSVVPAPATSQQPKRPEQLERSDSLLAKQKSTAPIIVCRKRSSISSKPSAAASSFGQTLKGDEKKKAAAFDLKPSIKATKASSDDHAAAEKHGSSVVVKSAAAAKAKDNPVITGTRSSRRTSMSTAQHENNKGSASKKKQSASPASLKAETPKPDKKGKTEAAGSDKKRSAAADFLKRIKRNSPADTLKSGGTGTGTSSRSGGEQKRRGIGGGCGNGGDDHGDNEDDEEEYCYGLENRSGWWKRNCSYRNSDSFAWIFLQISWRAVLSLCIALLVFYVATKPPPPKVSIQMAGIGQFGLGEGVDGSGVTTKFLTINCSINLMIENKSKLFGLHIRPPTMEMCFGRLPFALSHGSKLYAESGSSKFKLYVGTRNKPMYGAGRSMDDMLKSGKGLPLVLRVRVRSSFRVVWNLIKPKFHHQAECFLVVERAYDKKHRTQSYNSTCIIN